MFNTKDRHEFKPLLVEIEDSPTSPLARYLLWTLVAFMIITISWLYFAKVDIVVSGQGKVIPSGEIKVVQSMEPGVIKEILVKEGEEVEKNQTIMVLNSSVNKSTLKALNKNKQLLNLEINRLESLIDNKKLIFLDNNINDDIMKTQMEIFNRTKESNEQQLEILNNQIKQINEQINSNITDMKILNNILKSSVKTKQQLYSVIDIIAKKDYDLAKDKVLENKENLNIKKFELSGLKAKLLELDKQKLLTTEEYKNKLLHELTQKRTELNNNNIQINDIEYKNKKQLITSPVDGFIGKLLIHTEGGIVSAAQKLISIIPKDDPLVFKVSILNQDIGFIKKDMNVSIKISTFNFQKYGLINGVILHISDDAIEDEKLGLVYEVFIKPDKYYLEYANKKHKISSGMSITAEVKIGKRRIVNFFIYPLIRYLDEGMSVR